MKVAAITGERKAELVDKPDPQPKDDVVIVKAMAVPMCTEYKAFKAGRTGERFGHEAVGEVVAVDKAERVKVGDRVIVQPQATCGECYLCKAGEYIHCRTGAPVGEMAQTEVGMATMAQYVPKQEALLTPIPEGMSYDHAGMALCGFGPTFGAMQLMAVDDADTVLITGMGPVGLGGVINATHRRARVIAAESHPYRMDLAGRLGADEVVDPTDEKALERIMDLTGGTGPDKAVDCSGAPEAHRLCIDALRPKGHMCFVGEAGELTIKVSGDMIRKGLILQGTWHYNINDAGKLVDVVAAEGGKIDMMITHTFPLTGIQDAWELQCTRDCGKVVLHPWE